MKLKESLQKIGFDEHKAKNIVELIILTGDLDGKIKTKKIDSKHVDELLNQNMSIELLSNKLQKNWYQKFRGNGERQQILPNKEIQKVRKNIIKIADSLGFISKIESNKKIFDLAFILGSTEKGM